MPLLSGTVFYGLDRRKVLCFVPWSSAYQAQAAGQVRRKGEEHNVAARRKLEDPVEDPQQLLQQVTLQVAAGHTYRLLLTQHDG